MKTSCLKSFIVVLIAFTGLLSGCELAPFVPKPGGLDKFDPNEKKFDVDQCLSYYKLL